MTVTEIIPIDNKKSAIYIDCRYFFPLYNSEIVKFNLCVGEDIPKSVFEDIYEMIIRRIRERIFYLISDYDRSTRNIRDKLKQNGYIDEHIDIVLSDMEKCHYVDDYRYASNLASELRDNRLTGIKYIQNKLFEKGISSDIISMVTEEMEYDEDALLRAAISKKGYDPDRLNEINQNELHKLYTFLCRKGFSSHKIYSFIRK